MPPIGGGIVGLACALFLARDRADVLLADRNEPGQAASTANAGSIHVQLVPYAYAEGSGGPMADALPLSPASVALWREIARDADEDLGLRTKGGLVMAETAAELVARTGRHLSLKQEAGGHLLVGGGWPGAMDAHGATQVLRESLEGNLALAARALPGLRGVHVLRAWSGLAPHLDRAPVISTTPGLPGLWHAVTGNGYTLGPLLGPLLGRMVADAVRG